MMLQIIRVWHQYIKVVYDNLVALQDIINGLILTLAGKQLV